MHSGLLVDRDCLIELVLGANLLCCCEVYSDDDPVVAGMIPTRKPERNKRVEREVQ